MAKYLQLYLDTDFIIPIGVGDSGNINKYIGQQALRRLWLFFSRTSSNGMFDATESNKANFDAGREGFYGDFWKHVENNDKVPGESYKYLDLLDLSRIITKLREWSNATLFTETPEVVLNFSTVIPLKARRAFVDYINEKLGRVRSYSIEMNNLLSDKIVYDYQTLSPAFGDQLLIVQSAGKNILLSIQTWCGNQFMQGDEPLRLKKKGSEFLKEAIAKIVVDYFEQNYHMLLPTQKEKEYAYQMQFADTWLQDRNGDEDFWVDNFHYSLNPAKLYPPVQIDGKQLNLIEKEAIRNTINGIYKFYKENIINKHLHTILIGDVFKEEVFMKDCVSVTSSDGKYTFFNDNAIQEALGRYNVKYSTYVEDSLHLERIFMDKANERERIRTYVHNAEILGSLRDNINGTVHNIKTAVNAVNERNFDLHESWKSLMRQSKFSEASDLIEQMSTSDELAISKNEAIEILKSIELSNSLLIDLKQLKEVEPIVNSIRNGEKELRELNAKADELRNLPESLRISVQKYRDLYPRYKELKKQFEAESTLTGRRNIVDEMKDLTMEPMPILDIETISGTITVKLVSTGGFLGIGAKKSVDIKLSIDKPLPCRGVLIVSPKVITKIPEGRYGIFAIDVDKGAEGMVVETNLDFNTIGLEKNAKSIFVKFWPHENDKIPINRFDVSGGGMITL